MIWKIWKKGFSKTELILENQQTWREENSDLIESLETMKKRYGKCGRKVG
jgi:hypothetical protein